MNKLFTEYKLALALSELGFSLRCLATIDQTEFIHINGTRQSPRGSMMYDIIPCPLYQQVTDWLRDEHGIIIVVMPFLLEDNTITYEYTNYTDKDQNEMDHGDGPYEDYYDALKASIKSALSCI
jgi:hypothetical protein